MPSVLIIEDGNAVADTNSYADATQARDYATARGVSLPLAGSGVDPVESWLILAAEYLDSLDWIGVLATTTQGMMWPRVFIEPYLDFPFLPGCGAVVYPVDPELYSLPGKIKTAQMQLVVEQANGLELMPSTAAGIDGQFITREKVDVIETSYSEKLGTLSAPYMPKVSLLLRDLTFARGLRSVRV